MESLNRKAVILTVIILTGVSFAGTYSGGSGTETDPYQIGTVSDWQELMADSNDWDANFIMIADINLQGVPLIPVGNDLFENLPFTGIFDGNCHVIRNAAINMPETNKPEVRHIGLFGIIDFNSQIRNLGVEDVNMVGERDVSGLVGLNEGTITNCYATGKMGRPSDYGCINCAGLVGLNLGTITGSHASCDVNGDWAGGLVGRNYGGTITDCHAAGTVSGPVEYVGGLVGWNGGYFDEYTGIRHFSSIARCYATGSVSGKNYVGGLVGINADDDWYRGLFSVTDCYATGTVTGTRYVGGLVGYNTWGPVTDCHATGEVTGTESVGGLLGYNYYGIVTHCYATGAVIGTGYNNVGGLIGFNYGPVTHCYAAGTVTAAGSASQYTGGLMGYNSGQVTNCYAEGSVAGFKYVGGLVGTNGSSASYPVTDCYAKGAVTGTRYVGGLFGRNNNFDGVANCYAAGMVSGDSNVGGLIGYGIYADPNCFWDINTSGQLTSSGGTGKTTAEMMTLSTFTSAGWDFVDTWGIGENQTYPFLRTYSGADLNYDGVVNFNDFAIWADHWLEGI